MKSSIHSVLGVSEAQELYWDKDLPMSRLDICEAIKSGRLLGRKTKPNGGYIIDKRSVEMDVAFVEQIEKIKIECKKQEEYIKIKEAQHLEDMKEFNYALSEGIEITLRNTPCINKYTSE